VYEPDLLLVNPADPLALAPPSIFFDEFLQQDAELEREAVR
jgi:hypothetical protein